MLNQSKMPKSILTSFNVFLVAVLLTGLSVSPALSRGGVQRRVGNPSAVAGRKTRTGEQKTRKNKPGSFQQTEGTREMARLLENLGRDFDAKLIAQRPDITLARYFRNVEKATDLRTQTILDTKLAYELLLKGQSKEAAALFQSVKEQVLSNRALFDPNFLPTIRWYLAVSHLRFGEQQNCQNNHGADTCLLPIKGGGVHLDQEGSRAAAKEYTEILQDNPSDLTSRWLLNIAYMTLGEYPENVPTPWLIPPATFKSEYDIERFDDVAPELGLGVTGLAGGCIMEDFDGDGYLDIVVSSFGLDKERDQLRYFHNDGNGTFSDRTREAGLTGIIGGLNLTQADYNNDGHPDVLVLRGGWLLGQLGQQPPSLLRNNGNGTFDDVTKEAGLLALHPTQTAAWGDYDNDGWLDLFVGVESSSVPDFDIPLYQPYSGSVMQSCKLYHNNRDGTFTDVAAEVGLALTGYVKGSVWGDYNNDGFPDLYLSQMYGPGLLFKNNGKDRSGKTTFTNVLATEPTRGYLTWFWDYNNDGWLDIFVSGYSLTGMSYGAGQVAADYLGLPTTAEKSRLYRNNHDGSFSDVTRDVKLNKILYAMGGNFGDIDNDGWTDFYVGTGGPDYRAIIPNRMFRNAEGKFFQDVTTGANLGHLQKTDAIAFGDIDSDGDQDIYAVIGGEFPGDTFQRALYLNPGNKNHWLTLKLEGVRSNRSAIGARVKISLRTQKGDRDIFTNVGSGGSFGASSLQQEVGLGQATSIRLIEVTWPTTGRVQTFKNVRMDQIIGIREGNSSASIIRQKQLKLKHISSEHKHTHQ